MIILYTILAIIAVLAAVLLINTALQVRNARTTGDQHPTFTDGQLEVYGKTFSRMLQCATVSVQGSCDDTEFAKLRSLNEQNQTSVCIPTHPAL